MGITSSNNSNSKLTDFANTSDSSSVSSDLSSDSDSYKSLDCNMDQISRISDTGQLECDAAIGRNRPLSFKKLTMEDITKMNEYFSLDEKISLVYILWENPSEALEYIAELKKYPDLNIIKILCLNKLNKDENWYKKVLEAVTIIQNFQVLILLGYAKEELKISLLPRNPCVALWVNQIRKALFCIFDNTEENENHIILSEIQKDLSKEGLNYDVKQIDPDNLENTFLYLELIKYFTLKDVTPLLRIFKCLDMDNTLNTLKYLNERLNKRQQSNDGNNYSFGIDKMPTKLAKSGSDVKKDMQVTSLCNESTHYYIDPDKPGVLLIINNEKFYSEPNKEFRKLLPKIVSPNGKQLEPREGSSVDREVLERTFKKLKFQVVIKNNVRHYEIDSILQEVINLVDKEDYSSLFVAILSHGERGVIYGCNSIAYEISKITNRICCNLLSGKPKVLIIQACQGDKLQPLDDDDDSQMICIDDSQYKTDGPTENVRPRTLDLLKFFATIPNYSAVRHIKKGTWFIQSLCEQINNNPESHFDDIAKAVIRDVTSKRLRTTTATTKVMVPEIVSTLPKKLYLKSLT